MAMEIDNKMSDWKKLTNSSSVETRERRLDRENQDSEMRQNSVMQKTVDKMAEGAKNESSKNVANGAEKAVNPSEVSKKGNEVPVKSEPTSGGKPGAEANGNGLDKGASASDGEAKAKADAEKSFQSAKDSRGALENIFKTAGSQASEIQTKVPPQNNPNVSNTPVKGQVTGDGSQQIVGKEVKQGAQPAKKGEKTTQQNPKVDDNKNNQEAKSEVEVKAKVEVKVGDQKDVAVKAGALQGGEGQAKAEGAKGQKVAKGVKVDGKKGKSSKVKGSKVPIGSSEAKQTTAELASVLSGKSGESPFDAEPDGAASAVEVKYEPVDWKTGSETFTNIPEYVKSDAVRRAAIEHEQRTVKPAAEEVIYENWDLKDIPMSERFVAETAEMIEVAQQFIKEARLPKSASGYGTSC